MSGTLTAEAKLNAAPCTTHPRIVLQRVGPHFVFDEAGQIFIFRLFLVKKGKETLQGQ